jgi:hypothetical protein
MHRGRGPGLRRRVRPRHVPRQGHIERTFRDVYLPSFSPRTLVYKALATGDQLARYYRDLTDPDLTTDLVVYHRRYSTNTFSNWYLAQPFRTLGHNGEINTIKANRNAVRNLEAELHWPGLLMPQGSDSADVDRVVEMFRSHGVSLPETMMRMMPAASADLIGAPRSKRSRGSIAACSARSARWAHGRGRRRWSPRTVTPSWPCWIAWVCGRCGMCSRGTRVCSWAASSAPTWCRTRTSPTRGSSTPARPLGVDVRNGEILEPAALLRRVVERTRINFTDLSEASLLSPPARVEPAPGVPRLDPAVSSLFGITPARRGWPACSRRPARSP